jgi:hypothetical protein
MALGTREKKVSSNDPSLKVLKKAEGRKALSFAGF